MCRIAGIFDRTQEQENLEGMVKNMCRILQHGGPDDEGLHCAPKDNLVLGNRRLSLLDLSSAGHQPMSYSERYHITYNGELYNFPELKQELLAKGYTFKSGSDTEVILASFAEWGTQSFTRFNGMFAFALYDSERSVLYLARDASGIKPLYYYVNDHQLVFASEIKAFKPVRGLSKSHTSWPVYLMAYGHLPEPITTLQEVKPLVKGTFLQYNLPQGKWQVSTFAEYNYSYSTGIITRQQAIEQVREYLTKAVERHLLSDAAIGVFLSGGIDSSVIALLANKYATHLNTLSLYFNESNYSEKKYQDILQQQLHCDHRQYLLSEAEFQHKLPSILSDMDLPSNDGLNTWFISKCAKEAGLKAVLSGVGGDELFGGYPSFKRMNIVDKLQHLPDILLQNVSFRDSKKLRRLCYLTLPGAKGKYLFLRGHFVPSEIAAYLNMDEKQVWDILREEPVLESIKNLNVKDQAGWIEMNLYMQNQLLRDSDVMSMAHGIEIRVPFLDKELINLVLQIPPEIKYAGNVPKQLLIDSFKDTLPEPIWNRTKMGFAFPFKEWFAKNEFVKNSMHAGGRSATEAYEKFLSGEVNWYQIMALMLLQQYNEK